MSTVDRDETTVTDPDVLGASAAIRALFVVVVGAPLAALPGRLPGIVRVAQLTLTQFVQTVLLPARQLKITGTLVRVDVDLERVGRIRVRRTVRFRAAATEEAL